MPCCFTSAISFCLISLKGTVCVLDTIRFPCLAMGTKPSWRRPWPLECGTSTSGDRPIRKVFNTP